MTTTPTPIESAMLREVRRWRQKAYESRKTSSPPSRAKRLHELLTELGLSLGRESPRRRPRRSA
jgi:hypothetical protein